MTNTDDNFYDSELITQFIRGLLPADLHLKIQRQIEASEVFRTYVEGVRINFEESGKNFEKMEADIATKKAQAWSKLQEKLKPETTFSEKLAYTLEQLKDFFRPNPQLEFALQPTRTATLQAQVTVDDVTQILMLNLDKKNTQTIDFEVFNNKIQSILKQEIPVDSENFTLATTSIQPGIYYAKLKAKNTDAYMVRFYIREDLKPE